MGKASLPRTSINDTLDANKERKKQFGRERASRMGVSTVSSSMGSGVNSTGNPIPTIDIITNSRWYNDRPTSILSWQISNNSIWVYWID